MKFLKRLWNWNRPQDLTQCYQDSYFAALRDAGIPLDASQRTANQQAQSVLKFLQVSIQAGSLSSITQVGLEAFVESDIPLTWRFAPRINTPFSVAPAIRTGTFGTGNITYQGGATKIFWDWNIPSSTDYNNTSNHIQTQLIVDGTVWATSTWDGGGGLGKNGFPGVLQFDISGLVTGQVISVNGIITGTFNVGIANGLIS